MKKLFIFLFLSIFLFSFVSAVWYDNGNVYYRLDEEDVSGTGVLIDAIGNTNSTNGNGVNTTGKINYAYNLSGGGDYYNLTGVTTGTSTSISMWVWVNSYSGGGAGQKDYLIDIQSGRTIISMNNVGQLSYYNNGAFIDFGTKPSANAWHMITLTLDNSTNQAKMYVDGSQFGTTKAYTPTAIGGTITIGSQYLTKTSDNLDAIIDEVYIRNTVLDQTEITAMYNSGNGVSYPITEGTTAFATLTSPENASTISDIGTNFTVQLNMSGENKEYIWRNITYYVWQNGTLVNSTFINLVSLETNNTIYTQFIDDFTFADYEWDVHACYGNSTFRNCSWADNGNFTFDVSLYSVDNESYVNDTIGGTLENFSISIDLLPGYDLLSADFIYNGSIESPEIISEDTGRYVLVSDYQIPILDSDVNNTFYWSFTFTSGIVLNTTDKTQLVRAALLDDCSVYTNEIFNISLFDETTRDAINGSIEIIYSILNVPYYQTIRTLNYSVDNVYSTRVCSGLNLTGEDLAYSAQIRYSSSGYVTELYNIQRADLEGMSQDISLFSLDNDSSTRFKVTYQDNTFNFIDGAIIQLQRKYIGLNQYETVEAPLTSSDGTAILHIDLDSVLYRATVVKNGVVLDEFDNLVFNCESELTGECEKDLLGDIDPENDINYETTRDFTYSISRDNNTITVTFSVPSGSASTVNIQMVQKDSFGNNSMCNKSIVSSAGSIQCTFNDTLLDSYIDFKIFKDGEPMAEKTYIIKADDGLDWLGNNYIIVVLITLTLVGLTVTSPEWMVIVGILGLVLSGAVWLINGMDIVAGLGLIGFLLAAAIIIIIKLSKQEDR